MVPRPGKNPVENWPFQIEAQSGLGSQKRLILSDSRPGCITLEIIAEEARGEKRKI